MVVIAKDMDEAMDIGSKLGKGKGRINIRPTRGGGYRVTIV